MIILFLHRNFPAQFKNLVTEFAKNPLNVVMFITTNTVEQIPGVAKIVYAPKSKTSASSHPYIDIYEDAVLHGQGAAEILALIKKRGIKPDIIIGHSWGPSMFVKDVFPEVPYLAYFEWFSKDENSAYDFDDNVLNEDKRINIKCTNAHVLQDLCSCDAGLSPTSWQKQQFPKEFQNKIKIIHDGIDTDICKADGSTKFLIKDKNIELSAKDEVVTYATRGMEALRGFPQFMEAVEKLLVLRPNAHFVIGGQDSVFYGPSAPDGMTYKNYMLQKLNLDMDRVHFAGSLAYDEYLKLLQISSVHVYLTYPFVLSWSILEAMACECCVVASKTQPVLEVIQDNHNGFLVDFFNVNALVEKIEYGLDNPQKIQIIRDNARKTIIERYDKKVVVPQQLEYINEIISKN